MPDLAAPNAATSTEDLERAAARLSVLARDLAPAIETERRLPDELVGELRAAGLFRAGAPAAIGAPEAPPAVTLGCAEAVARGDALAGWCVSIAATSSLLAGWLPTQGLADQSHLSTSWRASGRVQPVCARSASRRSFVDSIQESAHGDSSAGPR